MQTVSRQVSRSIALGHAQATGFLPVEGKKFFMQRVQMRAKGLLPTADLKRYKPSKSDNKDYRKN
jgi:hypothetical protein